MAKKMVCELCGGSDFIKLGGVFVCQSCQMKYSPEDAKRLFQKINTASENSAHKNQESADKSEIDSLIEVADDVFDSGDYVKAYQLYSNALNKDPEQTHCVIRRAQTIFLQTAFFNDRSEEFMDEILRAIRVTRKREGIGRNYFLFCSECLQETTKTFYRIARRFSDLESLRKSMRKGNLTLNCCEIIDAVLFKINNFSESDGGFWSDLWGLIEAADEFMAPLVVKPVSELERAKKKVEENERTAMSQIDALRNKNSPLYWSQHKDERKKIESQMNESIRRIEELEAFKENLDEKNEINKLSDELKAIDKSLKMLKTFDIKEKIELLNRKFEISQKRSTAIKRAENRIASIDKQIAQENINIDLLDAELAAARPKEDAE